MDQGNTSLAMSQVRAFRYMTMVPEGSSTIKYEDAFESLYRSSVQFIVNY